MHYTDRPAHYTDNHKIYYKYVRPKHLNKQDWWADSGATVHLFVGNWCTDAHDVIQASHAASTVAHAVDEAAAKNITTKRRRPGSNDPL